MGFSETEKLVLRWATERGIFSHDNGSNAIHQWNKLDEEHHELAVAIHDKKLPDIIDALGDMLVVMTMIAEFHNVSLTKCYEVAYEEIKDRKGKMINGLFVKEL
jgi:NTP pyrophosphatase (non-canonical NTP hydrolase)